LVEFDGHLAFQRDTLSTDFPCATRVVREITTGLPRIECRLYNAYATAIPAYSPCLIRYDGDEETNPYVVSGGAASGTAIVERLFVPQEAVAASSYGWFAYGGYCTCLTVGTTDIAKDDYLQYVTSITAGLIKDGTTLTTTLCAIAREANATDTVGTNTLVFLPNEKFSVDQS